MADAHTANQPHPTLATAGGVGGPGFLMFAHYMDWHLYGWAVVLIGIGSILALIYSVVGYLRWFLNWFAQERANRSSFISRSLQTTRRRLIPLMLGVMGIAGVILIVGAIVGYLSLNEPATAIPPDPKIAQLIKERDNAIRERDEAQQRARPVLAATPPPQKNRTNVDRENISAELKKLSDILNKDAAPTFDLANKFVYFVQLEEMGASPQEQSEKDKLVAQLTEIQNNAQSTYNHLLKIWLPNAPDAITDDLSNVIGSSDPQTNPIYVLVQSTAGLIGDINAFAQVNKTGDKFASLQPFRLRIELWRKANDKFGEWIKETRTRSIQLNKS